MAAPNIVGVTNITGLTTAVVGLSTTSINTFLSNPSSSNKVYRINSIIASNSTGLSTSPFNSSVTIKYFNGASGAGTSISIATALVVPFQSSVVVVGKDSPIYLEENRSIGAIAGISTSIDIICSYEDIS